ELRGFRSGKEECERGLSGKFSALLNAEVLRRCGWARLNTLPRRRPCGGTSRNAAEGVPRSGDFAARAGSEAGSFLESLRPRGGGVVPRRAVRGSHRRSHQETPDAWRST